MPGSLIQGNALSIPLKDKSVQLCCFSPPYWNLRKYQIPDIKFPDGWKGQMGLEPDIDQYLDNLMLTMAEVWRVLRDDGCVFVNIGDGYKAKSLCLIPQKFAIRCQEAGWIVRSEIILQKVNPIPESVTDRCTRCHEQVWMLTKTGNYFWDQEAVKEKTKRIAKVGWKESDLKKYSCDPRLEKQGTYKNWRKYCPTGIVKKRNIRSVWTMATEPTKKNDWGYDFENADYVDDHGIPRKVSPDCPIHGLNAQPPQVSGEVSSCDEQQDQQSCGILHKNNHLSQEPFASASPSNDCKNLKEMDIQRSETPGCSDVNKKHDALPNGVEHKISSHNSNTRSQYVASTKDSLTQTYSEPATLNNNQNHKSGREISLVGHDKVLSQKSCRKTSKRLSLFLSNQERNTFENNILADAFFDVQNTEHTQTSSHNVDKSQSFSCRNNNAAKCTCQVSRVDHFATFSSKLINIIVKAGSSPKACEICGAPWRRVLDYKANYEKRERAHQPGNTPTKVDSTGWKPPTVRTLGWRKTCKCKCAGTGRCVVLDPFVGIGTSVLVAEKHGRIGVGLDLSKEYLWDIALKKIRVPVQKMLELRF